MIPLVNPTSIKTSDIAIKTIDIPIIPNSTGFKSLANIIDIAKITTCLRNEPDMFHIIADFALELVPFSNNFNCISLYLKLYI